MSKFTLCRTHDGDINKTHGQIYFLIWSLFRNVVDYKVLYFSLKYSAPKAKVLNKNTTEEKYRSSKALRKYSR